MDLEQLRQMMQDGTLGQLAGENTAPLVTLNPEAAEAVGAVCSVVKEAKLYYSQGKSDKVYIVRVIKEGDIYKVIAQYGRRGLSFRDAPKGVFKTLDDALEIFNKVVDEKEKKGYRW